jgi:hypothetical protein
MRFFSFILVHAVRKEESEKCKTDEGLKEAELVNVANILVEEPTTLVHFIKQRGIDQIATMYMHKGVDFFIECVTLRNKEGTIVLKEGEHAGKPLKDLVEQGIVTMVDHDAVILQLP